MGNVYFTADTHFGQQRTLELSRRPFPDVQAMDAAMVGHWNKVVGEEDLVYHLGDFGDPTVAAYLNGRIRLLPGNYDTPAILDSLEKHKGRITRISGREDSTFPLYVLPENEVVGLPRLFLIHEPETAQSVNAFYLYGHIHQLQMVKRNGLNVGVDCHKFRPIGLDVVKFYYDAITKHYDKNVFMPILGEQE